MSLSTWPEQADTAATVAKNRDSRCSAPAQLGSAQRHVIVELYDENYPSLIAYLRSLGMTAEDAEDVANESFVRLMRRLTESCRCDNLRAWLYRVAHNLSMDLHRANRRFRYAPGADAGEASEEIYETADPCPGPELALIEKESRRKLRTAVMLLTLEQRKCLLLRARGLRYRDIALDLGVSLQGAAALLERGTARLRVSLQ